MTRFKAFKRAVGFTLIEIMVAVAIFAVIASIVGPALFQFLDIRERAGAKQDQLEGLQKTFLFLANDLRYASNRLGKDEYGEPADATLTVGEGSLIALTASYPDLNLGGLGVPRRVSWKLEDGVLQRIQSPVMDPDGDTRTFKQSLLSDVREIEIELSIVEDGRDNTSKKWDEKTRLPDKIEITITMENKRQYRRVYSMLGGDTLDALAATLNAGQGGPGGRNGGSSGEGDADRRVSPPRRPAPGTEE
ncbi:MAG: prepilin-type N-terminal cleavage/methylation domain-containing protein [Arenicella sp.]|nr:prepilin-type N-terminal cleavage/methylation domain-containing protein [Arenicella sp.]